MKDSPTFALLHFFLQKKVQGRYNIKVPDNIEINCVNSETRIALMNLCTEFEKNFASRIKHSFDDLEIKRGYYSNLPIIVKGTMDELKRDGFTWSHMIALFVFGGMLVSTFRDKNDYQGVEHVVLNFYVYLETHLKSWLSENGSWDEIVKYERGRKNMHSSFVVFFSTCMDRLSNFF